MTISEPEHVYEYHTPYTLSDWQKYLSHEEVDFLDSLAKSLPKRPIAVNIGAGSGLSGLTFMLSRPDLFLYTIDVALEVNLWGGLGNEMGILKAAGMLQFERYLPIHQDSVIEGKRWGRGKVNMVLVDGAHEEHECRGDIQAWWPHLHIGGIMAIHDYKKLESFQTLNPGVEVTKEIMDTLVKNYPGVDLTTDELIASGKCEVIGVVHTLAAVRKVTE